MSACIKRAILCVLVVVHVDIISSVSLNEMIDTACDAAKTSNRIVLPYPAMINRSFLSGVIARYR